MRRTLAALALFTLVAAGCGSDDKDTSTTAAEHNDADVAFAKDMVPHHEQAVEMSDMALQKAENVKVKELATRIKAAQGPEIKQMKGWLKDWGESADDMGDHSGMPGMDMNGMMTDAEMKELGAASGAAFDKLFLEGMIRHHEGAVTMSQDELAKGKFPEAKTLAQQIIDSQNAEIAEMKALLGT